MKFSTAIAAVVLGRFVQGFLHGVLGFPLDFVPDRISWLPEATFQGIKVFSGSRGL